MEKNLPIVKIVTLGESSVGKTSLLSVFQKGKFPENAMPTIGLEFCTKVVDLKDGSQIKVQLFDTAGQEKYRSVISNYLRKALGVLLVYDITKRNTFTSCQEFFQEIQQLSEPDCVTLLVGNKTDLEDMREVQTDEGRKFATENKMYFIETSAKTQSKVNEAFERLFDRKFNVI